MHNWKKVFAIIWTGQFLSILSSSIVGFAIVLWLSIETGSAEVLAYGTIAALLPQSVLGFFSGILIDRWKRKRIMILSDSFIAFSTLLLAVLFYFDQAEITHIYILLALRSVGSAFHMPAMQASIPLLAPKEELLRIAGINQTIQSVCNIAGPAMAGVFITILPMDYILMMDVAGAIFACTALAFVKIPDPVKKDTLVKPDLWKEFKEGIVEVRKHDGLLWLFFLSLAATFFIMPVGVLFPLMTLNYFAGTPFQVSVIEVAWGGGALLGGALLAIKRVHVNEIILINCAYILIGISFMLSGFLSPSMFWLFALITILGGISGSIYNASLVTVMQTRIDPAAMGRVFAMFTSFSLLPALVGLLSTGFLADSIGIDISFIISGGVLVLIGCVSFFVPAVVRLQKSFRR